ncbi:hypothetical protein SLS58_009252 [Diplodia intermedia]|uniref:Uncharacterized protein n=1 Tax=Diplodia intermedia TaxID=856260 RepID=A0ABR3TDL6_9PEZI
MTTPLALLADTAKLLKAHTTKLSLLLLTPPFTATAIGKVLREMGAATVLDAVEELKEWGEDEDDGDDGDEDSGDEDGDDLFGCEERLGKGNDELRAQLDAALKKVKTIAVLYQALVKRRLKTYPAAGGHGAGVETLDELLEILRAIPDSVDEMASAYYDLDGDEAKKVFAKIAADAVRASDLVKQSWDGKDDEFTAWAARFQDAINA